MILIRLIVPMLLAGCYLWQNHVALDPPRAGITPEERVALFWKRRPVDETFLRANGQLVDSTLHLADKTAIDSPEDLAPLVGDESATMRAARESVSARRKASWLQTIGFATFAVGAFGTGVFTDGPPFGSVTVAFGIMGAGLVTFVIGRIYARREIAWRKKAFASYARDLGDRLDVCAHGAEVVPCQAPINPSPAVPAASSSSVVSVLELWTPRSLQTR
jgi:hypothetical protein